MRDVSNKELHEEVQAWRASVQHCFPTPTDGDALSFAVTEAAEALDAELRQNTAYKRNQDKAHSVERELTQCALMLLTPKNKHWMLNLPRLCTLHDFVVKVANISLNYRKGDPYALWEIDGTINMIRYLVPDLPAALLEEMARLEAKHCRGEDG